MNDPNGPAGDSPSGRSDSQSDDAPAACHSPSEPCARSYICLNMFMGMMLWQLAKVAPRCQIRLGRGVLRMVSASLAAVLGGRGGGLGWRMPLAGVVGSDSALFKPGEFRDSLECDGTIPCTAWNERSTEGDRGCSPSPPGLPDVPARCGWHGSGSRCGATKVRRASPTANNSTAGHPPFSNSNNFTQFNSLGDRDVHRRFESKSSVKSVDLRENRSTDFTDGHGLGTRCGSPPE